ncbi:MAG: hypothetical protein QME96_13215 [Myxococcota bacterium]|nr:hypothetical protein [Myxococcota bacterium]
MRDRRVRALTVVLAGAAGLAAGCTVSGGGAGIALGAAAVLAAWIAMAATGSTACYSSSRDDLDADVGDTDARDADGADDADAGPCLGTRPDVCLSPIDPDADAGPCLAPPIEDATDALPPCPPEYCDVCLEIDPDPWCELICPPPDASDSASVGPAGDARERLASLGVLSRDQIGRLDRLRGRA